MNVEWRRKTEQSAASSSKDQWMGGAEEERKGDEGGRKGEARGEGSSRGHEELEASAKELVMVRLPSDQERKDRKRFIEALLNRTVCDLLDDARYFKLQVSIDTSNRNHQTTMFENGIVCIPGRNPREE